jgi:hypothetical protein
LEAAAGRGQIRCVHQRDRVRLRPLATEQSLQQMLIDPAQAGHTNLPPKLVQHPHAGPLKTQSGLFGQLCHHQIQRMG